MNERYRELIVELLPEIEDEQKLHELYVHALMITKEGEKDERYSDFQQP